jgi:hypothetical protein
MGIFKGLGLHIFPLLKRDAPKAFSQFQQAITINLLHEDPDNTSSQPPVDQLIDCPFLTST